MSDVDGVLVALEQARRKLIQAKNQGLEAVSQLSKAQNSVSHTLGRTGADSPLLSRMRAKERACLETVMGIDALIARVDAAIAQTRAAAGGAARGAPAAAGGG